MAVTHSRPKRMVTGKKYKSYRKKRTYETGSTPALTKVGKRRARTVRTRGGNIKSKTLATDVANLYDPKTKKYKKAKIEAVVECPANRNYVRRNILVKGTIIKTDAGNAKVTGRPGQEGAVNAVLV